MGPPLLQYWSKDASRLVISPLQEEVDASPWETLLGHIACLDSPTFRRSYEDIADLSVIAHLCNLNGAIKMGKGWSPEYHSFMTVDRQAVSAQPSLTWRAGHPSIS